METCNVGTRLGSQHGECFPIRGNFSNQTGDAKERLTWHCEQPPVLSLLLRILWLGDNQLAPVALPGSKDGRHIRDCDVFGLKVRCPLREAKLQTELLRDLPNAVGRRRLRVEVAHHLSLGCRAKVRYG
jgi:hypothetical protein